MSLQWRGLDQVTVVLAISTGAVVVSALVALGQTLAGPTDPRPSPVPTMHVTSTPPAQPPHIPHNRHVDQ